MSQKLSLAMSATALVLVVLAVTPLGAVAQNLVPRNSVGPLQLKRNAVTPRKLAPNAVRTGHVLDGSLLVADFKPGQIPAGPKGDKGEKGDKGDKGDAGSARAWGSISSTGSIVQQVNVASVTKFGTGVYCVFLTGVNPTTAGAVATPHGGSGNRGFASVSPGGCSSAGNTGIQVNLWNSANALADTSFTIVVP